MSNIELLGKSKKITLTDIMQAGRLFFFHQALLYNKSGHHLTSEIVDGISQFAKVIEEADYKNAKVPAIFMDIHAYKNGLTSEI